MYCRLDVEVHDSEEPAKEKSGEASSEREASRAQWTSFFGVRASIPGAGSRETTSKTRPRPRLVAQMAFGRHRGDVKDSVAVVVNGRGSSCWPRDRVEVA